MERGQYFILNFKFSKLTYSQSFEQNTGTFFDIFLCNKIFCDRILQKVFSFQISLNPEIVNLSPYVCKGEESVEQNENTKTWTCLTLQQHLMMGIRYDEFAHLQSLSLLIRIYCIMGLEYTNTSKKPITCNYSVFYGKCTAVFPVCNFKHLSLVKRFHEVCKICSRCVGRN